MAIAQIGPTGYDGTFGILWKEFPYMERRGGYSGPFYTLEEAKEKAIEISEFYEEPVTIELVDVLEQ